MSIFRAGIRYQASGIGSRSARLLYDRAELASLGLFFAAYCLLCTGNSFPAPGERYEVREIKPHVFVWVPEDIIDQEGDPQFSRAGTAGFIITPDAAVAVDTTNSPFHARELVYEIRRRTDAPIKYVIDTDSQGDHTLGNEVFVDQQALIVATATAQAGMRQYQQDLASRLQEDWRMPLRMRGIHPTLPNQTFEGQLRLRVGGLELQLIDANLAPTGDLMVYVPDAKVLFLGDLYQNGYFPSVDARDIPRWIDTLEQAERLDVETYVPGHGQPGSKKELAQFRLFLTWLKNDVETRIKEGKSLDQVKHDLGSLENYHWHAPELAPNAVEAVYKQLTGAQRSVPLPGNQGGGHIKGSCRGESN